MVAYPGGVIQDIVRHLWTDNVVAHGQPPWPAKPEPSRQYSQHTGGADPM